MINLIPNQYLDSHQKEALLDITKLQIDMTINEYDFCTHDASSVAFACVLNAIESITDDGMFYANVETTMGEVVNADDTSVQDLRFAIYELMTGTDDDVGQRISKTSAKKGSRFVVYHGRQRFETEQRPFESANGCSRFHFHQMTQNDNSTFVLPSSPPAIDRRI